ncbi:MAG TPA: tetratricopeptide repeat protein [Gammaproteobacteria bacterium]
MNRRNRRSSRAALALVASLSISAWPAGAPAQTEAPPNLGELLERTPPAEPGVDATGMDPLRRARDALLAAGDASAARNPAEQLVGRPDAASDPRYADDLVRLGMVHTLLGEFDAAERRYFEAADVIRNAEGEFALDLVDVYRALGRSYIRERRFVEAITALEQAQHVSQRNLGLFNDAQAGLIDDLTAAYLGLGDIETAGRLQRERLDNAIRRFGARDPRVVPYRYGLARYYEQSRLRGAAREQYEAALETLEPLGDDAALLEPLRRLLRIDLLLRDRDTARTRIAEILERRPDLPALKRALALTALGDFALARDGDPAAAAAHYAEAWTLLADVPDERERLLGRPEMLDFVAPLTAVDRGARGRPYAWGTIVLRFDVGADGRARDVSVVSAEPAGLVETAYVGRIREAHFRPRIVDAMPAPTTDVRYTHYFRYYVAE